jgi:hypothetical protein
MGSYISKNDKNFISYETLLWLKKQVWAWILLGIFIMSIFFYIAKGLIVFIGGISLGVYLYNKYGKDGKDEKDNSINIGDNIENTSLLPGVGDQIFSNTMNFVKSGMINMISKKENFINFNENKLFNNMWWKNTR